MSGTSETVAACCCPISPCPCLNGQSSVVVSWSGSVQFVEMSCLDYWQERINGGYFLNASSSGGSNTYAMPAMAVPFYGSCGAIACFSQEVGMERYAIFTMPPAGSPASTYCALEQRHHLGTIPWLMNNHVSVSRPTPANPKWRVEIWIGGIKIFFISTDPNYTCWPTTFVVAANSPHPASGTPMVSQVGVYVSNQLGCGFSYVIGYPADYVWPATTSYGGTSRTRVYINLGTVSIS